ncbi:MAG: hypothetical protein SFT68_03235 [Rickettsiaceae bacterium]|nr:hypothetical protein [Rickettsiaceae bacterium]
MPVKVGRWKHPKAKKPKARAKKIEKKVIDLNLIFGDPGEIKKVASTLSGKDYDIFAQIVNQEVDLLKKVADSAQNPASKKEILEYTEKLQGAIRPKSAQTKLELSIAGVPNFQDLEVDLAALKTRLEEILVHLNLSKPLESSENKDLNAIGAQNTNTLSKVSDESSSLDPNQTKYKYITNEDIYILSLLVVSAFIVHYAILPVVVTEVLYIIELALLMHELLQISKRHNQDKAKPDQKTISQTNEPTNIKPGQANLQSQRLETSSNNQNIEILKLALPRLSRANTILQASGAKLSTVGQTPSYTPPKTTLAKRTPIDFATKIKGPKHRWVPPQ